MAFKLQITDEMVKFFRSSFLSDSDAGKLIRLLLDKTDGIDSVSDIPQPLTYVLPVFCGQIDRFRQEYERKRDQATERKRRQLDRDRQDFTREQREGRDSRVNSVKDSVTREQREGRDSLHTIPHQSISTTITGGGGALGTTEAPPPPRMNDKSWTRDDYARLAISSGWPKDEVDRFCDLNNSGRLNPADAIIAWSRHRTPTEEAGGANILSSKQRQHNAEVVAMQRALNSFRKTFEESSFKPDFIESCVPVWLRDCPDVPADMRQAFRQEVNAIVSAYQEEHAK